MTRRHGLPARSRTARASRRRRLIAGIGVLVLGGVAAVLVIAGLRDGGSAGGQQPPAAGSTASGQPLPGDALATPAPAAAAHLEPGPQDEVATDAPVPTDGSGRAVVLTMADWVDSDSVVEAAGFVQGVVENGGTCTLTLTSGSRTSTAQVPAEADASTTICGVLRIPGSSLVPGTWHARLTYASDALHASSDAMTVEVPQQ
jgi:hypothetical protein